MGLRGLFGNIDNRAFIVTFNAVESKRSETRLDGIRWPDRLHIRKEEIDESIFI